MVSAAKLDGRSSCVKLKLQFKQFSGTKTESDVLTELFARFICATTISAAFGGYIPARARGCPLILMRRPEISDVAHQMKSPFVEPERLVWPNHVIILNEKSNGDSAREQFRYNSNKFIFVSIESRAEKQLLEGVLSDVQSGKRAKEIRPLLSSTFFSRFHPIHFALMTPVSGACPFPHTTRHTFNFPHMMELPSHDIAFETHPSDAFLIKAREKYVERQPFSGRRHPK